MFALEAHEDRFGWRLAVNPIFDIVPLRVALADFVFRLSNRGNHFFAVHADGRATILNGLLEFWGERVDPVHGSGTLLCKIEERREELLQVIGRQIGHWL